MSDHDGVEQVITMAWRAHKTIAGRFPLFFSPFKMTIVPYEELRKDLSA